MEAHPPVSHYKIDGPMLFKLTQPDFTQPWFEAGTKLSRGFCSVAFKFTDLLANAII